jgi:hypothetical protein
MADMTPGPIELHIVQYGSDKPDVLKLQAYAEAAAIDRLTMSVGDHIATLKGNRLDEVAGASLKEISWAPVGLSRVGDFDELVMKTDGVTENLTAQGAYTAQVTLRDGRTLKVPVSVQPRRPKASLLNKGAQEDGSAVVHFANGDDLPLSSKLVFFLKSEVPQNFPRNQNVEVAAEDGSFHTTLSIADGSLILEDGRTALGTVDPMAKFGPSAFGPLRVRVVSSDGVAGDWIPLGTLVRVPSFRDLRCPRSQAKACTLAGANLFLAQSISSTQDMANPVDIPGDYTAGQVNVPHPVNGSLYIKLRDDPGTVQTLVLPVIPLGPAGSQADGSGSGSAAGAFVPANASVPKVNP